jgi:hypothetical protein
MLRAVIMFTTAAAAVLALTACQPNARDNSDSVIGQVNGGPGLKGDAYVECVNPVNVFHVSVDPSRIHLMHEGGVCPDGRHW